LLQLTVQGLTGLLVESVAEPEIHARPAVLLAALCLVATLACMWRAAPRRRAAVLALLLCVVATYGMIAVGRTFVHLTFGWPLESLAKPSRYHYAGPAFLALVLSLVVATFTAGILRSRAPARWLVYGLVAVATWRGVTAFFNPLFYALARLETEQALESMRREVAQHPPGATVYIPNRHFGSIGWAVGPNDSAFPGWAAMFVIMCDDESLDGRRVQFVESHADIVAGSRLPHSRIASLLVDAKSVPNATAGTAALQLAPPPHGERPHAP